MRVGIIGGSIAGCATAALLHRAGHDVMPMAEHGERSQVFDMPDLTTMPTRATNDWLSTAYPGFALTLPAV